jgi:hypothetical protein
MQCLLIDVNDAEIIGDELQDAEVDGATRSFRARHAGAARTALGNDDVATANRNDEPIEMLESDAESSYLARQLSWFRFLVINL